MDFIKSGILSNCRLDGRSLDEHGDLRIIPNISSSSHGSSQVYLSDNIVQVTVNFSIVVPDELLPDEGILDLAISSPTIFDNNDISQRDDENIKNILEILQFQQNCFDKHLLCILPSHFVWNLKIHIIVLQRGGSLIDAISIAIVSALRSCMLPSVEVMLKDEMESLNDNRNLEIKLKPGTNIEISNMMKNLPIITTIVQVGTNHICDVTKDEELCADGSISTAIDPNGKCIGIKINGTCFKLNDVKNLIMKSMFIAKQKYNAIEAH